MSKETLSTSEQEVPKIKLGLQDKYDQEKKEEHHAKRLDENNIKEVADQLPEPVGYRILVLPFNTKEKTKGGLVLAETTLEKQQVASQVGLVMAMGSQCYKDKERLSLINIRRCRRKEKWKNQSNTYKTRKKAIKTQNNG